ncbi:PAT family beta-lactamase induction signal transducer AmpG [Sphingomonas kyeonggiensis]|uniref:PAT family beta-lactamase induction signal transducer AmpG n=1 Tax=Sphingomonas kyeonggiensis TaxID=1268553 RepID=A0A7W6JT00_9SPHN|nr:PAT family beta-lactamase induction signal transducer AmpG [Sphingomonas kyeonggiensis]
MKRPQWAYPAAQLALAAALALLALPWLTVATPGSAPLAVHGYDFLLGAGAFKPSMTFVLGMLVAAASLVFSFVWRQRGGASLMVGGAAVGGVLVILAVLFAAFSPPKTLATSTIQPAIGYWLGLVALVAAFFAGRKAAPQDWRADLPEGVRPYFENAPLASFALGLSSGFPFAMIGATLTSRLKQDGIDKATITAFALAILVYNLKFLWAWIIDGVKLPILGRLGQRVSWLIVAGILVVAAVANMAFTQADPGNIWPMVTAAVLVGLAGATYDIVIDGYRIEILEPRQLGYGSGMSQYGWRIGSAGAGAVALVVAARFGWEAAYLVCALFALPAIIAGLILGEPERHRPPAERKGVATVLKSIWGPFVEFFQRQGAWIVLIFILVHKIGDTLANLTFRLLFDDLGFTNDEIAFYDVALGFFAYMIGVFIGGMLYARMGMKRSVLLSLVLMAVSNLSFAALAAAGHSNIGMAGAIGFENIASGFGGVVVIAYFSALTDLRFTAAQYALISAGASILGRFLTGTTAGSLIEAMGYVNFYLLTTLIALPGVFIYWWMMRTGLVDRSIGTAGTEGAGGTEGEGGEEAKA